MATNTRLNVLKTYKIYIGGQFPRTESGRYYPVYDKKGNAIANMCLSSRKDIREAIVAARKAFAGWSERAAFNRGQILYRMAEMLQGRKVQFEEELMKQGLSSQQASKEVQTAVDRLIYFSGWCDKYHAVFSSVNPVSSPHINFSVPEPMGVITIAAPEENGLIGLVSMLAPVIAGGNTCVILASEKKPLCAITLAEVLNSSDLPGGVVNIITGSHKELLTHLANHMDVNAMAYCGSDASQWKHLSELAALNVKRMRKYEKLDWISSSPESPYLILDFQETKTTWHPIELTGGAKGGY